MMTADACWFAVLSTKPSISPVTVPAVFPVVLEKEKSKFSAWHGVDASANADTNANAPKVILFMTRSQVLRRVTKFYSGLYFLKPMPHALVAPSLQAIF